MPEIVEEKKSRSSWRRFAVRFARKYGKKLNHSIATTDETAEALHLDKRDQWKSGDPSEFYPTFVDLLIMKEAKCLSLGEGGYGRFANILSVDPTCSVRHHSSTPNVKKTVTICDWHNPGGGGVDVSINDDDFAVTKPVGW